ncbi:MAG: hypothetical protein ABIW76_14395 [Fibrobacteria bacterium]
MKSVNPEATRDYVLLCDRDLPPAEQTTWKIVQLSHEEQAFIKDMAGAPGSQIDYACHLGLGGATNFLTADGDEVVWKRDNAKKYIIGMKKPWAKVLSMIPLPQRDELASEVIKGADLEVLEQKNS